ncbi:hypothetical protein [Pelagovum sp. HNIBRBA483]|uniref:hypothetical protein n=1 Tax=Pelagovum sp. HNIBRBA483 TaxID=3233341 RepID=UPI0034A2F8E7
MLDQTEKSSLMASLSALGQDLMQQAHDAQGQLLSKTQHAVSISDPQVRQSVQSKLDHSVNLLAIANIMAIFEYHFPRKYWVKTYNDPKLTKQLRAFKHMQHCAIYGFTGVRATNNRVDFDRVFSASSKPNWIASLSDDELFLSNGAAAHVYQVVRTAWERAIVAVHQM